MSNSNQNPNPSILMCPWCGCSASTDHWRTGFRGDDSGFAWIVECGDSHCGASGPIADSRDGAVDAWNMVARLNYR